MMDLANGTQALVAPSIAQKLGCKVLTLNGNIDGNFPGRGSEPTPSNLSTLTSLVKSTNADLGVALPMVTRESKYILRREWTDHLGR